jgi:hypothetical protein
MKKILLVVNIFIIGILTSFSLMANGPELSFSLERLDYGTVYTDKMPETKIDIEFSNKGTAPLVLSGVRACCGTRVISWPREPLMPGEKGTITVEFRLAPRAQRISRTVTVSSNDAKSPTSIFRIIGQVEERDAEPPR